MLRYCTEKKIYCERKVQIYLLQTEKNNQVLHKEKLTGLKYLSFFNKVGFGYTICM